MTTWKWATQNKAYANFGNANQWTVNAGLSSLARETAQNSNDARIDGQPADLVYRFIRLSGRHLHAFKSALQWDDVLRPHIAAMAPAAEGAVAAGQLKVGLESVDAADSLVLLQISDYGCRGLTGPEFADVPITEFGNFIKLCRLDLFSGKDEAAGGSFGLGKAVYWRFSRLQTVLFNSTLPEGHDVAGRRHNRVFGVQQGVVHRMGDDTFTGRGYFGRPDADGEPRSAWEDAGLTHGLHLGREDERPGTTALIVAFYDPDQPELGTGDVDELNRLAQSLGEGLLESFWPLLTRGRLRVRIEVVDDGDHVFAEDLVPEDVYTELVNALRRFDDGQIGDELGAPGEIVVRDVPITISKRTTGDPHESFVHTAKLVVTLSDDDKDSLENRVCLLRRPEMVVETIDREFEGRTYHGFLLAGASIRPDEPTPEDLRADDFLRFAEPPAHDRWIPGSGTRQIAQANLTAHYRAPWRSNLIAIQTGVLNALFDLFGPPPPAPDKAPEAVMKHLRFLRAGPGSGGGGGSTPRKPHVEIVDAEVVDGRWHVTFQVIARNREEGWSLRARLAMVGLDAGHQYVSWDGPLTPVSGGVVEQDRVVLHHAVRKRKVEGVFKGVSVADLPIPASESGIDVLLRDLEPADPAVERSVDGGSDR